MKKSKKISIDGNLFPLPPKNKHRLLKAVVLVSFFVGMNQILNMPKHYDDLPYNDNQTIPGTNPFEGTEQYELELAQQAYDHLLDMLYTKCENMGIQLADGYLVQVVAYDMMTDSIDVILQKDNQSLHIKLSAENLTDDVITLSQSTMSDQISALTNILDVAVLETPTFTVLSPTLSTTLQDNVSVGVQNFARTNVEWSDGDYRSQNDAYGLIAGRDYYYFNVYGTGTKDGVEYNIVTTVAMKADDYEIAGIDNLIAYYIENPQDEHFVVNMSYQEKIETLDKVNDNQTAVIFEP